MYAAPPAVPLGLRPTNGAPMTTSAWPSLRRSCPQLRVGGSERGELVVRVRPARIRQHPHLGTCYPLVLPTDDGARPTKRGSVRRHAQEGGLERTVELPAFRTGSCARWDTRCQPGWLSSLWTACRPWRARDEGVGSADMRRAGSLHVITGCMFSGKTEELLRQLRRASVGGRSVLLVRPSADTRSSAEIAESRSGTSFACTTVSSDAIHSAVAESPCEVVAIDEAEMFDEELAAVADRLTSTATRSSSRGSTQISRDARLAPCRLCLRWPIRSRS